MRPECYPKIREQTVIGYPKWKLCYVRCGRPNPSLRKGGHRIIIYSSKEKLKNGEQGGGGRDYKLKQHIRKKDRQKGK